MCESCLLLLLYVFVDMLGSAGWYWRLLAAILLHIFPNWLKMHPKMATWSQDGVKRALCWPTWRPSWPNWGHFGAKMALRGRYVGQLGTQVGQLGAQDSQLGSIFGSKLSHLGPFQKPVKTSYQEKNEKNDILQPLCSKIATFWKQWNEEKIEMPKNPMFF